MMTVPSLAAFIWLGLVVTGVHAAPTLREISVINDSFMAITVPYSLYIPEKYNVRSEETSVSGLSSGAYMAVQFHVSFSSTLKGAGITAGGAHCL